MKRYRVLELRGIDWTLRELIAGTIKKQDYVGLINANPKSWKSLDLNEIEPQVENIMEWQGGKISVVIAKEVVFWPANGGVRNKSGFLIADFFHSASKLQTAITHRSFPRYRTISIDTPCATVGNPNRNFYHRMVDSIPRVFCLWHPALLEIESVTLIVDQRFSPDELDLIKFLVPPNVKTVCVPYCLQVAAKNYIHLPTLSSRRTDDTPAWAGDSAGYLPQSYLMWFRPRALKWAECRQNSNPQRKIFISRSRARIRRMKNEKQVVSILKRRGFQEVYLEEISLRQQIALFNDAKCVVGQHGAGLANIIHMQSGGTVCEIMSSPHKLQHYSLLAANLGLVHEQMPGDCADKNGDVKVNLSKMESILDNLCSAKSFNGSP